MILMKIFLVCGSPHFKFTNIDMKKSIQMLKQEPALLFFKKKKRICLSKQSLSFLISLERILKFQCHQFKQKKRTSLTILKSLDFHTYQNFIKMTRGGAHGFNVLFSAFLYQDIYVIKPKKKLLWLCELDGVFLLTFSFINQHKNMFC